MSAETTTRKPAGPNPWIAQHIAAEQEYCGGGYSRREAARRVRWEYESAPDPVECECGGHAHYRATVGAMKCPSCGRLYRANGQPVG